MMIKKNRHYIVTLLVLTSALTLCTNDYIHNLVSEYIRVMWIVLLTLIVYSVIVSKKMTSASQTIDNLKDSVYQHKKELHKLTSSTHNNLVRMLTAETEDKISRSEFIVNISHELCAPLNAIVGYADLLSRTELTDKQRNYVESILHGGQLISDLAQEITTLANLESGEIAIKNQVFKIGNVLEDVLEIMGNRASLQKLELICEYNEIFESECISDPVRIRQILINLVSNAIKYTRQGYIILRVSVQPQLDNHCFLYVEVEDTGIGISTQDLERIFTPFCQLGKEGPYNANDTGAGLGLTINKRLVHAMGGSMGVTSEKGKGSTFWINLPCKYFSTSKQDVLSHFASFRGRNAMIIEDNMISCDAIVQSLEYFGVNTRSATSLESARKLINESIERGEHYNFLVIGSRINADSTMNFAMTIRQMEAYRATPFIITVPISEPLAVGVISRIQPALCINKPVLPNKFKDALLRVMRILEYHTEDELMLDTSSLLSSSFNDKKILVVDDNPVNRKLLQEMLREIRFFATSVADGKTALDLLYTPSPHRYDLVILDCMMPGMDGYEIASRIRKLNLEKQPVIIMTSADSSMSHQLRCYKSGADDFIEKPITHDNLISILLSWLPAEMRARLQESYNGRTVVNIFNAPVLDDGIVRLLRREQLTHETFIDNLYTLFVDDTSKRIDGIMRNIKAQNYDEIVRASHAIKSGCMQFGARRMSRYCDVLGNMAKNRNIEEIESSLNLLIHEYNRVISEFETYQNLVQIQD